MTMESTPGKPPIGTVLRAIRRNEGLARRTLAGLLNISEGHLKRIEDGRSEVSNILLIRICECPRLRAAHEVELLPTPGDEAPLRISLSAYLIDRGLDRSVPK